MKIRSLSIILIVILSLNSFGKSLEIKKVEPPFWWADMKNPKLQLLVYAIDIGEAEVQIKNEQIKIDKVHRVQNKNYLFIDLDLTNAQAGSFEIELKGKAKGKISYELKERVKDEKQHQGFGTQDVIYLLMPDRFSNANPENDSSDEMFEKADRTNPYGRHGGDSQGIINHLDYFNELGVTALWLNPFQENNRPEASYHGYACSDFYKSDPRIGSNEEYVKLVQECHKKDIKVIMDIVLNHCDTNNWFIQDLPSDDWIHQFSEFTRSNFRTPVQLDPYASDYDKNIMVNGWFDHVMADLNQDNPFLATYLIQNTIWWIEYAGIDGLRLDTQPYADKHYVAEWAKSIFEEYPRFNIVGEAWLQKIAITAYWQKTTNNFDGYNSNIPSVTDFPLMNAISASLNEKDGWTEGMLRLYYVLAQDFLYSNPDTNLIFVDNHDVSRFYTNIKQDINKFKMGIAFLMTTRGIPQIYYGTEILMGEKEYTGHGAIRKDFPGGWPGDEVNAFTEEGRTEEQNEAFDYLANISNWRKQSSVIHHGKLKQFLPNDGIYIYFRYTEEDTVMVVMNNNEKLKKVDFAPYQECLKGRMNGYEITSKRNIILDEEFEIGPNSAMIIELK